jgi:L-ascorbate metabolism protein UlaG (beta-lactamase superfamily)
MTRRRLLLLAACAAGTAAAGLAVHLGWFTPRRSWELASGWAAIPPDQRPPTTGPAPGEPRPSWLGHAGLLLEWGDIRLAVDPNLSLTCTVAKRTCPPPVTPAELGPLDVVLLSHAHRDHLDLPTLTSLAPPRVIIVPQGGSRYLPAALRAASQVVELAPGAQFRYSTLDIVAVPARHNGSRYHPFRSQALAAGYVLRDGTRTWYVAGDTGWGPHLQTIAATYQPDVAVLPIGAFAPRLPLKFYHLSPEDAVAAVPVLGVHTVYPIHFGTFTLSLDQAGTALPRFARAAAAAGVNWRLLPLAGPYAPPAASAASVALTPTTPIPLPESRP